MCVKDGLVIGETTRLIRRHSSEGMSRVALQRLLHRFTCRGYPVSRVRRLMQRTMHRIKYGSNKSRLGPLAVVSLPRAGITRKLRQVVQTTAVASLRAGAGAGKILVTPSAGACVFRKTYKRVWRGSFPGSLPQECTPR